MYRDIKLDNIVLGADGYARLCDMGLCRFNVGGANGSKCSTFCGTVDYLAPEVIMGREYGPAVDWWSFGVLVYEMLIGRPPFQGDGDDELCWSICNEEVYFPRYISVQAQELLMLLLNRDPSARLGIPGCPHGEIREQSFFNPINWEKLEKKKIPPPVKLKLKGKVDCSYFDETFLKEKPTLSSVDSYILKTIDDSVFKDFDYINMNMEKKFKVPKVLSESISSVFSKSAFSFRRSSANNESLDESNDTESEPFEDDSSSARNSSSSEGSVSPKFQRSVPSGFVRGIIQRIEMTQTNVLPGNGGVGSIVGESGHGSSKQSTSHFSVQSPA